MRIILLFDKGELDIWNPQRPSLRRFGPQAMLAFRDMRLSGAVANREPACLGFRPETAARGLMDATGSDMRVHDTSLAALIVPFHEPRLNGRQQGHSQSRRVAEVSCGLPLVNNFILNLENLCRRLRNSRRRMRRYTLPSCDRRLCGTMWSGPGAICAIPAFPRARWLDWTQKVRQGKGAQFL
jgi:hypothetical protein